MYKLNICRVCLCSDRRMYTIAKTVLQGIWERLTKYQFNINDGKPNLVCYLCWRHLKKSHELMIRALRAEESLTSLIYNGLLSSQKTIPLISNLAHELNYNYVIKQLDCVQYKQFEEHIEERDIKNGEECKESNQHHILTIKREREDNEYRNDMQIKIESDLNEGEHYLHFEEDKEDYLKSSQESYMNDVKPGICSDDNGYLKNQNSVVKLENVSEDGNESSLTRKYKLNEDKKPFTDFLSPAAPSTSINRINEENKICICNNRKSGNETSCHTCKCAKKGMYNIHIWKHNEEKVYFCNLCDYRGIRKRNLISHIRYKHTKQTTETKFTCHICEYKCLSNNKLIIHLRKHSGEKPFVCELCDYKSTQKSNLNAHIKYKHTKEKKFSCHICQYKCITKSALNKHFQIHTNEKPFVCELCDYRFTNETNLKNHIRCHHTKINNKNIRNDLLT